MQTVQLIFRSCRVNHLMKRCSIPRLTVFKLCLLRNGYLVARNGVERIVLVFDVDGANPPLFLEHPVYSRKRIHVTFLHQCLFWLVLCFQLGIQFRSCLLQIGLCHIEHLVHIQLRIDIILLLLLSTHSLVVVIGYLFFCLLVYNGETCQHHRKTLLSLVDADLGQRLTISIRHLLLVTLLVGLIIQAHGTVEGAEHRQLIAFLLTQHGEQQGIHAVILPARQVLRPAQCTFRKPRLLPSVLASQRLDLLYHHVCEGVQGSVLSIFSIAIILWTLIVICHTC